MGAVFGRERQQVDAVEADAAAGDAVGWVSGQHTRKGALAGAVGSHYGMDFAGAYLAVESAYDLLALDRGVESFYFKKFAPLWQFFVRL